MRRWLVRRVEQVKLPEKNGIDVTYFQCHNFRASKLTWLSQKEGLKDAELMKFSGHKSVENLHKYIKVETAVLLDKLLKATQKKYAKETGPTEAEKPVVTPLDSTPKDN